MKKPALQPMADVSAVRNEIGKAALGMLSSLLLALISWGAVQLWASKLSVEDYGAQRAKDVQRSQLDSVHIARQDREIAQLQCAVNHARCKGDRRGR